MTQKTFNTLPDLKTAELPKIELPKLPSVGSMHKQRKTGMSSKDYYKLASDLGLKGQADRILDEKGEEAKTFLSGGFISDVFDTINAVQYGIAGMIKGKGFIEGIRTRQSFADKDALGKYGITGTIMGIALDIAIDPFTYIAPWTIAKKIPGVAKAGKAVGTAIKGTVGGTKIGQWFASSVIYRFGQSKVYRQIDELRIKNIGVAENFITKNIAEPLSHVKPGVVENLFVRNPDLSLGLIPKADLARYLDGDDLKHASALWDWIDDYGKQAKELGLIDNPIENYVANKYRYYEQKPGLIKKLFGKKPRFKGDRFKARKLVAPTPDEISNLRKAGDIDEANKLLKKRKAIMKKRESMGEIKDSMYPMVSGLIDTVRDVENYRFFKKVSKSGVAIRNMSDAKKAMSPHLVEQIKEHLGVGVKVIAGDRNNIGRITKYGEELSEVYFKNRMTGAEKTVELATDLLMPMIDKQVKIGKKAMKKVTGFLPLDEIEGFKRLSISKTWGDLSGALVPKPIYDSLMEMTRVKTPLEKTSGKLMGLFKIFKTVLNPATHGRNIIGNFTLNSWEGLSPARMDMYMAGLKSVTKKDDWYKVMQKAGLGIDTFAANEIDHLLMSPEVMSKAGKFKKLLKKYAGTFSKIYGSEEEWAKASQFIFQAKKLGAKTAADVTDDIADKAWRIAERATFNYSQVTPFVRRLRESIWGYPFITFAYKATPQAAKTLVAKPAGFLSLHPKNIGKIKNAIESMSGLAETKRERASEPQWVKDGFYIKLPMKDKHGRSAYFDLTYIIPFGDLVSGKLYERQIDRDTGMKESFVEAVMSKSPVMNLVNEMGRNQDFYGNKIWRDSDTHDKQLADLFRHVMKTYLPPLVADQIPGGHIREGRRKGERRPGLVERIKKSGPESQFRDLTQEVLRNVGLKIQPMSVDIQEKYMEWEKKKALQTLLGEQGYLDSFRQFYVAEDIDERKF